jgi:hypothetical protein
MTPANMAKHRNNPNMPFWKMIKEGNDHFEVTRQEPKVDFCENKYVFNATQPPNSSKALSFNASGKCPAYVIADDVAEAVREKQQADQAKTAELIAKGTPVARLNTGIDGGMNRIFAAKLPDGSTGLSEGGEGQGLALAALTRAPGTIPPHVNPPRPSDALLRGGAPEEPVIAVTSTTSPTRVASAAQSDGFFSNLARRVGIAGSDTTATATPVPAKPPKVIAAAKGSDKPAEPPRPAVAVAKPAEAPKQVAAAKPALKPSLSGSDTGPAATGTAIAGAAPVVPANSFESRFSAVR